MHNGEKVFLAMCLLFGGFIAVALMERTDKWGQSKQEFLTNLFIMMFWFLVLAKYILVNIPVAIFRWWRDIPDEA